MQFANCAASVGAGAFCDGKAFKRHELTHLPLGTALLTEKGGIGKSADTAFYVAFLFLRNALYLCFSVGVCGKPTLFNPLGLLLKIPYTPQHGKAQNR